MRRYSRLFLASALVAAVALSETPSPTTHPQSVRVNGKVYAWPKSPVVVILIDGGDPAYVNAAAAKGLLPNFRRLMTDGFAAVAQGAMPSFTNPNNVSVITGVPPSVHGISGNFFLNPATGEEQMLNSPEFVRAESILARFSEQGAKVATVTAKDKLAKILAAGLRKGITFSAEKADHCTKADNGIADCLAYVGKPLPSEYSADLSYFALEAGLRILEREKPDLLYISLSDFIQHKFAPGSKEADEFYVAIDRALGRFLALGATLAITGDHGMNDKADPSGAPRIVFLQDVLDQAIGAEKARVILPITDPYVKHHGALGSFATVFLPERAMVPAARQSIERQSGVEIVLEREQAVAMFDLPGDRIGDLVVVSDSNTVLGKSKATLDLSQLGGTRLRSHGGLADRNVYLILSRPLNDRYAGVALSRPLRNYDVFDFALNGLREPPLKTVR